MKGKNRSTNHYSVNKDVADFLAGFIFACECTEVGGWMDGCKGRWRAVERILLYIATCAPSPEEQINMTDVTVLNFIII